jgi:hypothetical protein
MLYALSDERNAVADQLAGGPTPDVGAASEAHRGVLHASIEIMRVTYRRKSYD